MANIQRLIRSLRSLWKEGCGMIGVKAEMSTQANANLYEGGKTFFAEATGKAGCFRLAHIEHYKMINF